MRSKSKMYQPVTTFQIRWLTKALLSCSFIFYASQLRQKCTCSLGVQQASAGEHLSLSHVRGFVFLKWILQRSWRPVLEDEILSLQQTSEIKTNIEVLIILCMSWIKNNGFAWSENGNISMLDCHEILYRLHQVIILKNDNNFDHLLKTTMINIFELYIQQLWNQCERDRIIAWICISPPTYWALYTQTDKT